MFIFALIYNNLDFETTSKIRCLLNIFYNYQNCFDFKNIKIFFKFNNTNYIIDLFFKIKLLYNLFYAPFEKKLYILQNYFLKNFVSKRVCELISNTNVSIFFVSKSNKFFRLCVNYRSLNTITIKN